jgi:hypothetical protein
VHKLRDAKALRLQLPSVIHSVRFPTANRAALQRALELVEEPRHAILDPLARGRLSRTVGDLPPTAADDGFTMSGKEVLEHCAGPLSWNGGYATPASGRCAKQHTDCAQDRRGTC